MSEAGRERRGGPLRAIGVRTLGVVAILLLVEVGLRELGGYGKLVVLERTGEIGWRMLPDQDAWGPDLEVRIRTNALGYRGPDWEARAERPGDGAPAGAPEPYRVAVLGNSLTFGGRVRADEVWPTLLERALVEDFERAGDPRRPVVMNFAVGGYVVEQMQMAYERDVRPFRPDLVVLPVHPRDGLPLGGSRPDVDYLFRDRILRSATYDFLNRHVIDRWIRPRADPEVQAEQRKANERRVRFYRDPFAPPFRPLWADVARRATAIARQVVEDGGELLVVSMPSVEEVVRLDTRLTERVWTPWLRLLPPELASRVHVLDPTRAFHDAMPDLARRLRGRDDLWRGDEAGPIGADLPEADQSLFLWHAPGHYNAAGMRVLAEEVLAAVRAILGRAER